VVRITKNRVTENKEKGKTKEKVSMKNLWKDEMHFVNTMKSSSLLPFRRIQACIIVYTLFCTSLAFSTPKTIETDAVICVECYHACSKIPRFTRSRFMIASLELNQAQLMNFNGQPWS
jgi:hypothetical protein